jgi:glycosyltransferase involved in cell wall biosynthesis
VKVGVCDYPSAYAFPPYGYGGIERWLWAVAVGAQQAGAEVHLIGPAWRRDLPDGFDRLSARLEDLSSRDDGFDQLKRLGLDLLVVGHEYPSLPTWRSTWSMLGNRVVTFQHDPNFRHLPDAFDGNRSRLFCYSPEMVERYAADRPAQTLSVQFGLGEETPQPAVSGNELVWLGRIDGQKAPHLAIEAARQLGRTIRLIGPVLDHDYAAQHAAQLQASHVELVGELSGEDKLQALREARVLVYTCAPDYVEAGAAVFGESLRCGTPVAALVWRAGTCAQVALCERSGAVVQADKGADEAEAATRLAEAIVAAEQLDARDVQEIGLTRFSPEAHFRVLASGNGG